MIPPSILTAYAVAALLALVVPVLVWRFCRQRLVMPRRNLLVGIAVFLIAALVLEAALNYTVLRAVPTTRDWLQLHPFVYAAYGGLAAGLFEETGRYIAMKSLVKRGSDRGGGWAYGIGHGGIEYFLVGFVALASTLATALLVADPAVDPLRATLQEATLGDVAMAAGERMSAFTFQIAESLLVWSAVVHRRVALFGLAVLAHATVDFGALLAKQGVLSANAFESAIFLVALMLAIWGFRSLPPRAAIIPT